MAACCGKGLLNDLARSQGLGVSLFGLFAWNVRQDSTGPYCIVTVTHLLLPADTIQASRGCRESSQNWISVFQVRVQETIREIKGYI